MNTIRKIFGAALLLTATFSAMAQTQSMSLRECIEYGLENHRSNNIYENEILLTDAKNKEISSAFLPQINASGAFDDNLKVQTSVLPGALVGSDEDIRIAFTKQYSTNISAQLDQTIYDQSLIYSIKANKFASQEAELNKEINDETIIYTISTAYYQVLVSLEKLEFLKSDLETYRSQLDISTLRVDKGVMTEVDKQKIEVQYYNTLSQINVAENTVTLNKNRLKFEMGMALASSIEINSIKPSAQLTQLADQNIAAGFAAENLRNFQLSAVDREMLTIEEARVKALYLPKLTAYARYGAVGFGDNVSQSFSTLADFAAVGLKLNIPIFSGFQRQSQVKQAHLNVLNAYENIALDRENYELEYLTVRNKLMEAQSNLKNEERSLELSQSISASSTLQYEKGVLELNDWLIDQQTNKESQYNYLNSLFAFYEALVDLEKAKGSLKEFFNALP